MKSWEKTAWQFFGRTKYIYIYIYRIDTYIYSGLGKFSLLLWAASDWQSGCSFLLMRIRVYAACYSENEKRRTEPTPHPPTAAGPKISKVNYRKDCIYMWVTKVPWVSAIVFHFCFPPQLISILVFPHHSPRTIVFSLCFTPTPPRRLARIAQSWVNGILHKLGSPFCL